MRLLHVTPKIKNDRTIVNHFVSDLYRFSNYCFLSESLYNLFKLYIAGRTPEYYNRCSGVFTGLM